MQIKYLFISPILFFLILSVSCGFDPSKNGSKKVLANLDEELSPESLADNHFDPSSHYREIYDETPEIINPEIVTDPILEWNEIALNANAIDHGLEKMDQGGPTRTSRAFAIIHLAMYDALNAIYRCSQPYLNFEIPVKANGAIAASVAAYVTLRSLYPSQADSFDEAIRKSLNYYPDTDFRHNGMILGKYIGMEILKKRRMDGSERAEKYYLDNAPGMHKPDPNNPKQGFLGVEWGKVLPFAIPDTETFAAPPPPELNSQEYADAFNDVKQLGGDGTSTPTERTADQSIAAIYWAYDGTPGLGTPPRLYNQIARVIAQERNNTITDNARLFALLNVSMADAAIQCWSDKYNYRFWRPILGIRRADEDDNTLTQKLASWNPFGAPSSNSRKPNFTPNFPSYTSGHATFGAAALGLIANFYGSTEIPFTFVSDEFNGQTRGSDGKIRPHIARSFESLTEAINENARSRIYLGIHWQFDADQGINSGHKVADYVIQNILGSD